MPCDHDTGCPITEAQKDFRARIAAEIDRGEQFLLEQRSSDDEKAEFAGVTLGAFAGGRIDAARFSSLMSAGQSADPTTIDRVDEAVKILRGLVDRLDDFTKIAVPPHGSLRDTVAAAIAEIGRVFGAARVVELARTERYVEGKHARFLRGLRHAEWSAAERGVVPRMRVILRGEQMHVGGLAEFLDGGLKIILKPQGACPPAPLATLATPGVFLAQVPGKAELGPFKSFDGPAVALLGGEDVALFSHDPRNGRHSWERISLVDVPQPVRRNIGGISAFQQNEGLALLEALATRPEHVAATADAPAAAADPADRLASWLLGQAGLTGNSGLTGNAATAGAKTA